MARPKTTTAKAEEHENYVAEIFEFDNGRRSPSSGAMWNDDTDVVTDSMVIECEYTEAASYRLERSLFEEAKGKIKRGRMPGVAIRFRDKFSDKHIDLLVIDLNDQAELLAHLRYVRSSTDGELQ